MTKKEFTNKKAFFDYQIIEEIEAGVELRGKEIKAIRSGRLDLSGSYAKIIGQELFWVGGTIQGDFDNNKSRKLLIHKHELEKITGKLVQNNFTLVPLKGYFKGGFFKLLLGLGRGKKRYDKRQTIKRRELDIELSRKVKIRHG